MSPRIAFAALLTFALVSCAGAALALTNPRIAADGAVALAAPTVRTTDLARQRALTQAPAWRRFVGEHGRWSVIWNEATGTPHRAVGRGIALPGFSDDAAGVDRAVRGFVASEAALLGTGYQLETVKTQRVDGRWYARYRQAVHGVPVLFESWEFRVGAEGRLFAFGVDGHRVPDAVVTRPSLPRAVAAEAAKVGLPFVSDRDRVEGGEALYLLPTATESGLDYRLVYDFRVRIGEPPGNWVTLVDAANGEVLWRMNRVRTDISGTVTGTIHPFLPTDGLSSRNFKAARVTVGASTVFTNASGFYTSPAAGTVAVGSQLLGSFVDVNRQDAADASFSTSIANPATVNIAWNSGNSHDAERDAYYQVNIAHDYAVTIDSAFTGNDYSMPCAVNINATCNAFWDGTGVNFYAAGGGCPNTATMPDVVYHEYGHGVNDNLYMMAGAPFGMINGALHEGLADVNQAFIQDNPDGGKGFFGPGTILRTADNTNRWPADASGDPHVTGLIISGSFWDLRQAVGLATAEHLVHFAKYGIPDNNDDGVAMNDFFVETLVADDDDNNLSNGTPHSAAIAAAFNAHGIGTGYWIDITHAPLADQTGVVDYPVIATIQYTGPFGALDASSPRLHFSINGGSYSTRVMTPTGSPDQFATSIPNQQAAVVRYYISAGDNQGGSMAAPDKAPAATYTFLAGPASTVFLRDMETDPGWVVGAPGDNALTGIWLRADPVGTDVGGIPVQPEDDHTANPAVQCFVTGNAAPGAGAGTNDVDGGHTTLTTPAFDATGAGAFAPMIEYYRWYSNNAGSTPGTDFWHADISNDGGTNWVPVENTNQTDNSWRRVLFFIKDYVAPTANMKMRFIAADEADGSLVEAAVDDFRLIGFPSMVSVDPAAGDLDFALARPLPNPIRMGTRLRYTLPSRGPASLVLYDIGGRAVCTMVSGDQEAGEHSFLWNGADGAGRRLSAGAYFLRLRFGSREAVQKVLVLE